MVFYPDMGITKVKMEIDSKMVAQIANINEIKK
jgi:hypothetical protein